MTISGGNKKLLEEAIYGIKKGAAGGILLVVAGNIALLTAKLLAWLVVPKVLGVIEYGYYKTFTLYLVYAMMLHFGFSDGILLLYGGKDYHDINQKEFRVYTKFFIKFQMIISAMIIIISLTAFQGMKCYTFCMIGVDALFANLSTYYKFISQAVMQFRKYTLRNIIQALMQIVVLGIMVALSKLDVLELNGEIYILSIILIDVALLAWYMITYKDLTFGKADSFKKYLPNIKKIFEVGILLTISYQIAHLIFVLDSQMVEVLFDITTYSMYAFAYSIANMITAIISAIATVMFPSLKRLEVQDAVSKFSMLMATVSVIVFLLLTAYFPLTFFVKWFLPDYVSSLDYLQIIMPGLALSSCINLIIFTYYKVLNQLKQYLFISFGILLTGGTLNFGGYILYHDPIVFSIASIITLLIWYLCSSRYLSRSFHTRWRINFVYVLLEMLVFYMVNIVWNNSWKAMLIYFMGFTMTTCLIYKNYVSDVLHKYRK